MCDEHATNVDCQYVVLLYVIDAYINAGNTANERTLKGSAETRTPAVLRKISGIDLNIIMSECMTPVGTLCQYVTWK